MTDNQKLAHYVMGYVPAGYVCIVEWSHGKGLILQDGEPVASFRITPEIVAGKY